MFGYDVGQILLLTSRQYFVRDHSDLVLYSLGDGQSVQLLEHWSYVVAPRRTRHDTCQSVLNKLEFVEIFLGSAIQQRVAVVKPGVNYTASYCTGYLTVENWSNVPQRADVEVAGSDYISNVIVKSQVLIKCHAQAFEFH